MATIPSSKVNLCEESDHQEDELSSSRLMMSNSKKFKQILSQKQETPESGSSESDENLDIHSQEEDPNTYSLTKTPE